MQEARRLEKVSKETVIFHSTDPLFKRLDAVTFCRMKHFKNCFY